MSRRKIIIGVLALVVCGALAVVLWPKKEIPEPVYKGKKLSEWVEELGRDHLYRRADGGEATYAIDAIGTNGIPYYTYWLQHKTGWMKRAQSKLAAKSFQWFGVVVPFKDRETDRAYGAYFALGILGNEAETAIPQLVFAVTNSASWTSDASIPSLAIEALGNMWGAALPAYLTLMTNTDARVRKLAITQTPYGSTYVQDQVRTSLNDQDFAVRVAATNAMKRYDPVFGGSRDKR
jgi:hypothetical protein